MIFSKNSNNSPLLGLYITFTVIFLIAIGPYLKLQQVATLGLLPSLALITFLVEYKTVHENKKEFLLFALIFLTSLTTVYYYIDYELFIRNLSTLFGSVVAAYIGLGLTKDKNYEDFFHVAYILSIIALFLIMYTQGNIDMVNFASQVDYRDRFMLNANFYSYISVFANFSLFYLFIKYRSKIVLLLLIVMPLLFLIIAFTTQSRQGLLLIILINLGFWVFVNRRRTQNKLAKLFQVLVFLVFVTAIGIKFYDIFENSRIKSRVTRISSQEDARETLVYDGLKIFAENPVMGVGLGQFPKASGWGKFTHNSYTEILSEHGIIGGILLLIVFGRPTLKSYRNFKKYPESEFARCNLLFFIIFLLYNNAYIFYKFPFSMLYFFLIIGIQYKFNRNNP
jgi:O-antigen ligase